MSTIINQPSPLYQYGLLWVATLSATFHANFLDQRLTCACLIILYKSSGAKCAIADLGFGLIILGLVSASMILQRVHDIAWLYNNIIVTPLTYEIHAWEARVDVWGWHHVATSSKIQTANTCRICNLRYASTTNHEISWTTDGIIAEHIRILSHW